MSQVYGSKEEDAKSLRTLTVRSQSYKPIDNSEYIQNTHKCLQQIWLRIVLLVYLHKYIIYWQEYFIIHNRVLLLVSTEDMFESSYLHNQRFHQGPFKNIGAKKLEKKLTQITHVDKRPRLVAFQEKRIFCRKFAKIDQNTDYNIEPRYLSQYLKYFVRGAYYSPAPGPTGRSSCCPSTRRQKPAGPRVASEQVNFDDMCRTHMHMG
jgi:hypothetical protein